MDYFSSYFQPLISWLHYHPYWALFITFVFSFAESLAIIGSIVPGSVTMTAIGILAGSGVMRIDLTLLAAILGAIAGDSASYALGFIFRDRLVNMWPFRRYPNWLLYGKDYFARHGGKSVIIGRFVGPLRSIIPVIAGMMGMSQWRFLLANSISAIGWSFLYVLPGVLIGAASSELSPESATRLFLLVLLLLAGLWLLSVGLKWMFIRLNYLLRLGLHGFWSWSGQHPYLAAIFKKITPQDEVNYHPTAAIVLLLALSISFVLILTGLLIPMNWTTEIDQPIQLFLQSLRTKSFDAFFILVSEMTSKETIIVFIAIVAALTVYFRDWRSLMYWLSLCLTTTILLLILQELIAVPRPQGLLATYEGNSFPIVGLTYATALFSTFMFFINTYCISLLNRLTKIILVTSLFFAGFAPVYLGDHWLTDALGAYLCGFGLSLIHWLFYRRHKPKMTCSTYGPISIALLVILTGLVAASSTFHQSVRNHQPYLEQYLFTDEVWWHQSKPLLPVYRTNRIGKRISVFNIQYAGSLGHLEEALSAFGWQKFDDSLLNSLIKRVSGQLSAQDLPLMTQLYLNKKPVLMMTYQPKDGSPIQLLRMWRSNYHLKNLRQPIWIGSAHPRKLLKPHDEDISRSPQYHPASLLYVSAAVPHFLQRRIPLSFQTKLPVRVEPILLLIKEPLF
jgi:membrane protein DedA with SNARE-associated domain